MKFITQSKLFLGLFTVISGATQASHHFEAAQYLADTRVAQVDNFIFQSEKKTGQYIRSWGPAILDGSTQVFFLYEEHS